MALEGPPEDVLRDLLTRREEERPEYHYFSLGYLPKKIVEMHRELLLKKEKRPRQEKENSNRRS